MRLIISCLLFCIAIGCSRETAPDRGIAEARRVAEGEGARALLAVVDRIRESRNVLVREQSVALAGRYGMTPIEARTAALDAELLRLVASHDELRTATIVALGSDGSVFASAGPLYFARFDRSLVAIEGIHATLASGGAFRGRGALADRPIDFAIHAVSVAGAVVGAIAILEPLDSIVSSVAEAVREYGGPLERSGVCLEFDVGTVCSDVPDVVRRAAASPSDAPRPERARRVISDARIGGSAIGIPTSDWTKSLLLFVPSPL